MSLLCYHCFPLSVFLHCSFAWGGSFYFGRRCSPIFFQVFSLVQPAMPVLSFFEYFTNKKKKEYPKYLCYIKKIATSSLIVLCSHFNLTSSQRVVLLFLLKWNPCCIRTEEMLLLLRSWTNSSLCSLSTPAGVMDLQCFLCCRVALLLLLCKTFCWSYHTND